MPMISQPVQQLHTMDQQQTDAAGAMPDGFHTTTLGYELSATHAWLEFPLSTTPSPTSTTASSPLSTNSSGSDVDDPDYARAWNFAAFVRQQSRLERAMQVQQVTLTEEPSIDTTIILEDQP